MSGPTKADATPEMATEKQIAYIKDLGGTTRSGLTKRQASHLIDTLRPTASPTRKQLEFLRHIGAQIPETLTREQASALITELDDKPPSKAQLSKIARLGGDPSRATNNWRADEYIAELEEGLEQFKATVDEALEWVFGDPEFRSMMPLKKPTKAIMGRALKYGDAQGWAEGWSSGEGKDGSIGIDLILIAVYAVAPELLKKGKYPPRMPSRAPVGQTLKGKGCLIPVAFVLLFSSLLLVCFCRRSSILPHQKPGAQTSANQASEVTARKLAEPQR